VTASYAVSAVLMKSVFADCAGTPPLTCTVWKITAAALQIESSLSLGVSRGWFKPVPKMHRPFAASGGEMGDPPY